MSEAVAGKGWTVAQHVLAVIRPNWVISPGLQEIQEISLVGMESRVNIWADLHISLHCRTNATLHMLDQWFK